MSLVIVEIKLNEFIKNFNPFISEYNRHLIETFTTELAKKLDSNLSVFQIDTILLTAEQQDFSFIEAEVNNFFENQITCEVTVSGVKTNLECIDEIIKFQKTLKKEVVKHFIPDDIINSMSFTKAASLLVTDHGISYNRFKGKLVYKSKSESLPTYYSSWDIELKKLSKQTQISFFTN